MAQWFVECGDPNSNENLARELAALGLGKECEYRGLLDTQGKPHDVFRIPARMLKFLKNAKQSDDEKNKFQFRFFVRDTEHGLLRAADFLEQSKAAASLIRAKADLAKFAANR